MQQTKFVQQNLQLYNHGLSNCSIHLKQPHSNMHGHLSVTREIDNQSKSIHTTMKHPYIKTSKTHCCICKIRQNMMIHGILNDG